MATDKEPKFRGTPQGIKKQGAYIVARAIAQAEACGDAWNAMLFRGMKPARLTTADRELITRYLGIN